MAIPAWFWPPNNQRANEGSVGSALTTFGVVLADWCRDQIYPFTGSGFSPTLSGAAQYPGACGIVVGNTGNGWVQAYNGPLSHLTSGGYSQTAMPSGFIYTGIGFNSSSPYIVESNGALFLAATPTGPGLGSGPCWDLVSTAATLFTLQASQNRLGTYTASTGATGYVNLPSAAITPTCIAANSTTVVIGGTQPATLPSGAGQAAFTINPANPTLLLGVSNGTASVWVQQAVNTFSLSTTLTGVGTCTAAAWVPTGTQALVCNGTSVLVLGYSAGALTTAQTLAVSGGSAVIVMPSNIDALVTQPAASQVTKLAAVSGAWTITGTVTGLSAASCVAVMSPSQAVVGYGNAIVYPTLLSGVWSFASAASGNVGIPANFLTVDTTGLVYVAESAAGAMVVMNGTTIAGSGTWTGAASGIAVYRNQVIVPDPSANLVRVLGSDVPGVWTVRSTVAMPGGFTGLGVDVSSYIVAGSGAADIYNLAAPYSLVNAPVGVIGFFNGSSWTTGALPINQVPSAITLDASGNAHVATVQNNLYTVSGTGAITATSQVTQYAGQTQSVPLGVSSLCVSGTSLFAATSMPGVLVQVQ